MTMTVEQWNVIPESIRQTARDVVETHRTAEFRNAKGWAVLISDLGDFTVETPNGSSYEFNRWSGNWGDPDGYTLSGGFNVKDHVIDDLIRVGPFETGIDAFKAVLEYHED